MGTLAADWQQESWVWGIVGVLLGAAVAGIRTAAFCCRFASTHTRYLAAPTARPALSAASPVLVERPGVAGPWPHGVRMAVHDLLD